MKKTTKLYLLTFLLGIFIPVKAQVAIGKTTPEGMLDLQNNNSIGLVFPKVALTASNVQAPVTNPNGGSLVEGTVVFNTNVTNTGANDVSPGIYAWDGSQWNPQYLREQSEKFEQSPLDIRTETGSTAYNNGSSDWMEVDGIGDGSSFTPKYSGIYRIETNFNFGAGKINLPSSGKMSMSTQEGLFRFTFDGTPHVVYTHSYSLYNEDLGYYEQFRHDTSQVFYVNLTAGQVYPFKVEIDIFVSDGFENNGDSGDGRGHVGVEKPCTVEFTFIE